MASGEASKSLIASAIGPARGLPLHGLDRQLRLQLPQFLLLPLVDLVGEVPPQAAVGGRLTRKVSPLSDLKLSIPLAHTLCVGAVSPTLRVATPAPWRRPPSPGLTSDGRRPGHPQSLTTLGVTAGLTTIEIAANFTLVKSRINARIRRNPNICKEVRRIHIFIEIGFVRHTFATRRLSRLGQDATEPGVHGRLEEVECRIVRAFHKCATSQPVPFSV